jgi:hypothetical protein
MDAPEPMPPARWRPRKLLTAALFVAFVSVQVLVPALQLAEPRPARFGWQMYTAVVPLPSVWVERPDGQLDQVDVGPLLVRERGEMDLAEPIAEALCASQAIEAVVIEQLAQERRYPCD